MRGGGKFMAHMFKALIAAVFVLNCAMLPLATHAQNGQSQPEEAAENIGAQISSNFLAGMDALGKQDYPEARSKCKLAQFLSAGSTKDLGYFQFRAFHGMASACVAHAIVKGKLGDACPAVKAGKEDFIEALLMTSGHAAEKKELYSFSDMIDAAGAEAGCEDD
jgi:hypothetical protein